MKSLGLLIALALAGFLIYPLAMQRTDSECVALSREIIPVPAPQVTGAATPLAARAAAARALPGWPTPIGCAWLYWHFTFNPPG